MAGPAQSALHCFVVYISQLVHTIEEDKSFTQEVIQKSFDTLIAELENLTLALHGIKELTDKDAKRHTSAIHSSVALGDDLRLRFDHFRLQTDGVVDEQEFQAVTSLAWSRLDLTALTRALSIIQASLERYMNSSS
jgi:hypothetical protein